MSLIQLTTPMKSTSMYSVLPYWLYIAITCSPVGLDGTMSTIPLYIVHACIAVCMNSPRSEMASATESLVNPQSSDMALTSKEQVWPLTVQSEHRTLVVSALVFILTQPQSSPVTLNRCPPTLLVSDRGIQLKVKDEEEVTSTMTLRGGREEAVWNGKVMAQLWQSCPLVYNPVQWFSLLAALVLG